MVVCKACPTGKLAGVAGLDKCNAQGGSVSNCEAGKYSDGTDCQACPAGRAKAEASPATSCPACATGHFQPDAGKATCTKCADGHVAAEAQTVCAACSAGKSQTGLNACTACPFGMVQPSSGKSACNVCATNTKAQAGVHTACTACGASEICAGGAAAARAKPTPASDQSSSSSTTQGFTLKASPKKAVKNAHDRSTEMAAYFILGTIGVLAVALHRLLPQGLLKKLDQYSMAHHVQDGEPLIKKITALGGAFAVFALSVGTMTGKRSRLPQHSLLVDRLCGSNQLTTYSVLTLRCGLLSLSVPSDQPRLCSEHAVQHFRQPTAVL
jgi:hypothetical protein